MIVVYHYYYRFIVDTRISITPTMVIELQLRDHVDTGITADTSKIGKPDRTFATKGDTSITGIDHGLSPKYSYIKKQFPASHPGPKIAWKLEEAGIALTARTVG